MERIGARPGTWRKRRLAGERTLSVDGAWRKVRRGRGRPSRPSGRGFVTAGDDAWTQQDPDTWAKMGRNRRLIGDVVPEQLRQPLCHEIGVGDRDRRHDELHERATPHPSCADPGAEPQPEQTIAHRRRHLAAAERAEQREALHTIAMRQRHLQRHQTAERMADHVGRAHPLGVENRRRVVGQ